MSLYTFVHAPLSFVYRWLNIFCVSFVQTVRSSFLDSLLFKKETVQDVTKKKVSNQPTGHTNNKVTCALPPILSSPVVKCVYSASTELYVCSKQNQWNEDYEETRARYKNKNEKLTRLLLTVVSNHLFRFKCLLFHWYFHGLLLSFLAGNLICQASDLFSLLSYWQGNAAPWTGAISFEKSKWGRRQISPG